MRVLAIVYCYPPMLVPASICYLKAVACLRASGVDVEIVTIDPRTFLWASSILHDESLVSVMPDGVENHVVRSPECWPVVKLAKRLDAKRRFTYRWLEPKKLEWTFPARRLLAGLDWDRFDAVLSCSQPHCNHLLGLDLKRRLGKPWIAYFSDPWTDNPYTSFPSERMLAYHRKLEGEVLREADAVLYTCEEMKQLVMGRHPELAPERAGVLPHAFVPAWYEGDAAPAVDRQPGCLHLLQTGSFYGPRTPLPLIEALERVARDVPLEGRIRVDSYGNMEPEHVAAIRERGLEGIIRVHGYIPYLETLRLMRRHDALILVDAPLGTTDESVFLPSKLIDYLGSGKPVIAATPARGATARVVAEAGGVVCPLATPDALSDALLAAIQGGVGKTAMSQASIQSYAFRNVGRGLVETLRRVSV